MTLQRLRRTGLRELSERPEPPDARTPDEIEDDDEYGEKYAEIVALSELADETRLNVIAGVASPDQIREALDDGPDPFVANYAGFSRSQLFLTCVNHGISPETGRPDPTAVGLLLQAINAGMSEQAALRMSYLAAHEHIPAQMLADDEFVDQLAAAQDAARSR